MAGTIKVNYSVMEQIIADIHNQADKVESYGKIHSGIAKSKGTTATELNNAARDIHSFASVLAAYMRETARLLEEAEETMKTTDGSLATQFDGGSQGNTSNGGDTTKTVKKGSCPSDRNANDSNKGDNVTYEKTDVRLSDCVKSKPSK